MDLYLSIFTLVCLLHPMESRLEGDPCFPCLNQRPRLHPLNVSTHLKFFVQTLQASIDWMSGTLEEVIRPDPLGCDMEMGDEAYPDVHLTQHCSGNRLTDFLKTAFRVLSDAANNITMANDVIGDFNLRGISRPLSTHLKTPLCYLWESLASLGHFPSCPTCNPNLPEQVNRGPTNRCNYVFISYRRAILVAERVISHLQRPVVQSSNRQCYSYTPW